MAAGVALSTDRPFPGLRPFGYADRGFFFGRDEQIYALYNLLELSQFVAVVGSSGSGKSSLVRAGLLPLLEMESEEVHARHHEAVVGREWRWMEMRPGDAPLNRLADGLADLLLPKDTTPIEQAAKREGIDSALRRASFGMSEALAGTGAFAGQSLLIVVDQFEELFRYGGTGAARARLQEERDQFVQLLLEATSGRDLDVHVLITMRSDFIGDCAQFSGLPEAVMTCQFLVPSLTRGQREEVIRRPLDEEHADSTIEPALVERLLNDAGNDSDQLPVLQHCLSRLWEVAGPSVPTPPRRQLRQSHYSGVGGIADALSRHADEILDGLAGHEIAVEQVLRALSEVDSEGRATRRALSYAKLRAETGIGDDELRLVVDRFRADDCSFLVPSISAQAVLSDDTTVDIGHEALLRRWQKIGAGAHETLEGESTGGWLEAEADDGRVYRAMVTLAGPNPAATLPLDQVEDRWAWWRERPRTAAWADRYGGRIERVDRLFENSLAAKKRLIEGEHAARRWRRIRLGAYATVAVLVIMGAGAFLYLDNQHKAEIASISKRQEEIAKKQARIARQERSGLLNEMTDITQSVSTQLRFTPGTNTAILQMLNQVQDFSAQYSKWLIENNPDGVSPLDQRVEARLKFTARILQADYWINFGKIGDAIALLDDAEKELEQVPSDGKDRALLMLSADIKVHRANGEVLFGALDAARQDYSDAQGILSALVGAPPAQLASQGEEMLPGLDYRQAAAQRLAELYQGRLLLDLQFLNDAKAAAMDLAAYRDLIKDQMAEHSLTDAKDGIGASVTDRHGVGKFWSGRSRQLSRLQADTWVAQARPDEAIAEYEKLIANGPSSANASAKVLDAFLKYKLALALTKRAQGGDLAEAVGRLGEADEVFSELTKADPKNSWWPLVCSWIERAQGDAYSRQGDKTNAANAYLRAIKRDQALAMMDQNNPRTKSDLERDKTALAEVQGGE